MKTFFGLVLFLIVPGAASAQLPVYRPPVSPYLNLLQNGQAPGINYYGIVRPELEFRSSIQKLQLQSQGNAQAITDVQSSVLPATGHFAGFMTQGTYFQSLTGGAAGVGGASFGTVGGASSGARSAANAPRTGGAK